MTNNSWNSQDPVQVAKGGTGIATTTAYAPIVGGTTATGAFQAASTGLSSSGYVLTSNGASAVPSFQALPASGIVTVNGNSGSVTGATITIMSSATDGTSNFSGSATTLTFNESDAIGNTGFGYGTCNGITSGQYNCAFGFQCLQTCSTSTNNSAFGFDSMQFTTGGSNSAFGTFSLYGLIGGVSNSAFGNNCFSQVVGGNYNTGIGSGAGSGHTGSDTGNICIGYNVAGTVGDNYTTRIGIQGTQTACYVAGISGVSTSNSNYVTIDTSTGQLGSIAIPAFLAYFAAVATDVTGDGTAYTLSNFTEVYDQNSDFNVNGTFTAPVTGKYHFCTSFVLYGLLNTHTTCNTSLVATSSSLRINGCNPYNYGVTSCSIIGSADIDLTAADTVTITTTVIGGTKVVGIYGQDISYGAVSWMSGHLVC